jgi:hypothetical protein
VVNSVRKFLLLILIAGALYWAYGRYGLNPAILGTIQCPTTIAWYQVPTSQVTPAPPFDSVVAMDGDKWRLEIIYRDGKMGMAVFDGQQFGGYFPSRDAGKLDPITPIRALYAALPKAHYDGSYSLAGHPCWRFSGNLNGWTGTVWIDKQTHFPLRVYGTGTDGKILDERYVVLPIDIPGNADRLFDTRSRAFLFRTYFPATRNTALGSEYTNETAD